jgi:hypothetical protein
VEKITFMGGVYCMGLMSRLRYTACCVVVGGMMVINPLSAQAEGGALSVQHTLFKEAPQKAGDKKPSQLVEVTHAVPGDHLTGVVNYEYKGNEAGNNVVVTIPLKEEFKYVDGSATNESMALFSTDKGETYAPRSSVTKVDENGVSRPALAEDITHIRWKITKSLKKGDKGSMEYKIILK